MYAGPDIKMPNILNVYQMAHNGFYLTFMAINSAPTSDASTEDYLLEHQLVNDVFIHILSMNIVDQPLSL